MGLDYRSGCWKEGAWGKQEPLQGLKEGDEQICILESSWLGCGVSRSLLLPPVAGEPLIGKTTVVLEK